MAETVAELQVVISASTDELTAGLRSASTQAASFGESFRSGLGVGTGIAAVTAGLSAVVAGLTAAKSAVIDFNQQLDQSRAVFTRYFEGNGQQAEAFLTTLKGFAATTPFEFKDLSTFAIRLQNANTNANDIIPTLKAIGNAASATGSLSKESVDRITLALTQMQMKGKVSGDEMLQLTEANVPAWNILADATGKPVAQLQKMASAGEITADTFVKAFRQMYEGAGLMEGASKTLEGALSTVSDVGTQALADIGRSVYDLATTGANQLATFLSSDAFATWVQAAQVAVSGVVAAFQSMLTALAPIGETIAAAFAQLTSGDFAGAFSTISTAIGNALGGAAETLTTFAQSLFGAGTDMVAQLAGGLIDGASGVLSDAVNVVADTIAAFLIGASPPPEGPLSKIDEGGANTIKAWGQGAADAADAAVKPVAEKIAGNIGELKLASRDAGASIREIGQDIRGLEEQSRDLKFAADDIKTAYDDQIKAIDSQVKSLEAAHDVERDREALNLSLEEIQLRQAEIAAGGDKEAAARIKAQIDALKTSEAERKNKEAIADADKELAGSEKDRLKTALDAKQAAQQESDLRARLKTAKTPEDKTRIKQQLDELATRKQIAEADAKERQEAATRRAADAAAKRQELDLQGQLNGLTDKEALARIKTAQDALQARKQDLSLAQQAEALQRQIAEGPLKEQKAALIADRDAALKPLTDQLDVLTRQKAALSDQRTAMQAYKADIDAAAAGIRDQEAALKSAAKTAKEAALDVPTPKVDKTFTPDAAAQAAVDRAKAAGEKLAQSFADGFAHLFDSIVPDGIAARLGAIATTLRTDGVPGLVAVIGSGLQAAVPVLAAGLSRWLGEFVAWADDVAHALLAKYSELLAFTRGWIESSAGPIGESLAGWELAFLDWAGTTGLELASALAALAGDVLAWIGDTATDVAGALVDWATAFVAWVAPRVPELLSELGTLLSRVVEWMGAHLGELLDAIGAWAVGFVEWVGPKIPPLLAELGKLLVSVTDWAVQTALPAIVEKLGQWAAAIVDWVAPRILPLLAELGTLLVAINTWAVDTALPAIIEQLAKWSLAFVDWVVPVVRDIPGELMKIGAAVRTWMDDRLADGSAESFADGLKDWVDAFVNWPQRAGVRIGQALADYYLKPYTDWINEQLDPNNENGIVGGAVKLGAGMLGGMQEGLSSHWGELKDWITENIGKKLPEWMQSLLGIKSPSTVFADIGANLIAGLIAGMESKQDELIDKVKSIYGGMAGAGGSLEMPTGDVPGELDDWLNAAIAATGVGRDWLSGLRWIAMHESTGNPHAVNPTAVDGQHAAGLMQTMPSTFGAYALSGMHDIFNPVDNAAAAIRYIQDAYSVDLGYIIENWSRRGGYAEGGWAGLHGPELAWLGERGPEYVVPNAALRDGRAGMATQTVSMPIVIGGRVIEELWITGRDLAIRRGRVPGAGAASMASIS
jgi:tape measure domain-containing protein